jgi:hypothetical protein
LAQLPTRLRVTSPCVLLCQTLCTGTAMLAASRGETMDGAKSSPRNSQSFFNSVEGSSVRCS